MTALHKNIGPDSVYKQYLRFNQKIVMEKYFIADKIPDK